MSNSIPQPASIDGTVISRPDGDANFYWLMRQPDDGGLPRWLARIQWNGELLVIRQEQMTAQIVAALNAHRTHPLADKLAAVAQGETYDEAALNEAYQLLRTLRERAEAAMYGIHLILTGYDEPGRNRMGDAAVLLAAVEPLYPAKQEGGSHA